MNLLKYSNILRVVVGSILLWAAWPVSPFTFLIFVAWLPLFLIAEHTINWKKFLGYTYLLMLLWNVFTTWWVAKSTVIGGVAAFFANSLIMCIPWVLYFFAKRKFSRLVAGFAFIAFWITYEYIHHNWDLSWPWLTLGNVFATHPNWVQWYEYTGTTGGTLWVLLSNVLAFHFFMLYKEEGRSMRYLSAILMWALVLCLPILFSFLLKNNLTLEHNKYNVVVVQPNFDPWDEKFVTGKQEAQLQKLVSLSQQQIDVNTALVVWPETAVPVPTDETKLKENFFLNPLWSFLRQNPKINLLTGIEGYKEFVNKKSRYARKIPNSEGYYEGYNSAVLFDSSTFQIYHKSKLVPGVEVLPAFLNFMAPVFEKFGGTASGYARDSAAKTLNTTNKTFIVTPAICYESIYSDYLADANRKGANLICIITNDGWWGNTAGYKQHMNYARLRAIESRKWVARSANTGISCIIDPYGNVTQQLPWNTQGALKQEVAAFTTETFYTKYGDYLSKIFSFLSVAFILWTAFSFVKNKKQV
jgi:apolipoprotein N-acyltransferase